MSYSSAKTVAVTILLSNDSTEYMSIQDRINSVIENQLRPIPYYSQVDFEKLATELAAHFNIVTQEYKILEEVYTPWLAEARSTINFRFWHRYKDFLLYDQNMAPDSVAQIGSLTDDILDRLANPMQESGFDKRGMVVGHVQSGKTGNYTGLICKAADAGYKWQSQV